MGVEVATYVNDLVTTNPTTSDLVAQGDDHIRLLKAVLQNTFPSLSKAIYFQSTSALQSADFSITAAQMQTTFRVDTSAGAVNVTLPTLGAGDGGWECFIMKTTADINPMFIKPASGLLVSGALAGLSAARRAIPFSKIACYWSGTAWGISRSDGMPGPVGSCIEYHGTTLPFGYEYPNGQTLASAATNYPEYFAVRGSGVTLDKRGRVSIPLDNLGGAAAGRLAGGFITGTAIGNVGGTDFIRLAAANIPTINVSVSGSASVTGTGMVFSQTSSFAGGGVGVQIGTSTTIASTGTCSATGSSTNTGGGSPTTISNLPPSIMVSQLLMVE